jgi:hypothetical protein
MLVEGACWGGIVGLSHGSHPPLQISRMEFLEAYIGFVVGGRALSDFISHGRPHTEASLVMQHSHGSARYKTQPIIG